MKRRLVSCILLLVALLLGILPGVGQGMVVSAQSPICQWRLVSETPTTYTASTAPDASVWLSGTSIGVEWQGLSTTHEWTAPPMVLKPGSQLSFGVSTAWESKENDSVGGLSTSMSFGGVDTFKARRDSIIFNSERSGSVSNEYVWTVPVGAQPGATLEIIARADAAVAGGNVRYLYQYVCEEQTATVSQTPRPTKTALASPTVTGTPACLGWTEEEKLQNILQRYYATIPKGIVSTGERNNILDFLGYPGYSEFVCGAYQSKVLNFLNALKFSQDPCEQVLLTKWEYAPIQAWWGGHQAVVLYPWATNWMETGYILDPWIEQKPMVYAVQDWAVYFSVAGLSGPLGRGAEGAVGGSFIGIGPSEVYRSEGAFPIFGGDYAPAGLQNLSAEEMEYIKSLPDDKQALFRKLPKTQQKYYLQLKMNGREGVRKVLAHCPLTLYVIDAQGARSGIVGDEVLSELADVSFAVFPLQDGTFYTELIYPVGAGYTLVMQGRDVGQAYVLAGSTFTLEEAGGVEEYIFGVEAGMRYQFQSEDPGALLTWQSGALQPRWLAPGSTLEWLERVPSLMLLETDASFAPTRPARWQQLVLGGVFLLLIGGLGLVTALFWLWMGRRRAAVASTLALLLLIGSCLLAVAGIVAAAWGYWRG
jgi:hypothetical protein